MALVPQESTLNSNKTLEPSACLGPQVGSSRLILSGCTVGQVEVRVVTTAIVPSAEQTDGTEGQRSQGGDQSGLQLTQAMNQSGSMLGLYPNLRPLHTNRDVNKWHEIVKSSEVNGRHIQQQRLGWTQDGRMTCSLFIYALYNRSKAVFVAYSTPAYFLCCYNPLALC